MLFGDKILNYWDDILADLSSLIAIPSVSVKGDSVHPFGDECAKAIDCVMDMSQKYGLKAKNVDYYAMHAEYGEGEENAVVMAHVDVVPVTPGWDTNPFEAVIKDGKLFGRGAIDDKSGAVIALHCLRALKDEGVQGKRKLRVVLGSSEETGMADMDYYFDKEQIPTMGFTPDGEYGICHCEKGNLDFNFSFKNDSEVIKIFEAGTVLNAVPNSAKCVISCTEAEKEKLKALVAEYDGAFTLSGDAEELTILSHGVAAHASLPELGKNAISLLVDLLYLVFGSRIGTLFSFVHQYIGMTCDGSQIGVAMQDEPSGALTFNLAIAKADSTHSEVGIDIRFPATKTIEDVRSILAEKAEAAGITFTVLKTAEPLYLPKDSKIVNILSSTYEDVMQSPCTIYSMGGGTYAKKMHNAGVAFGPVFEEKPNESAHMINEYADLEELKKHARICLEAMYRMLVTE
ncbi:Sapep family Mn(2+)-dependent dipeptidase [Scatolibacter rhodanostii]|uniref:Sapep family Mn(2+)-dependent dipeptidase n=1 Tax=Scatolibacter rhodanostii TaxID=2014781 RepID=UPI000C06E154|nr:Sapep family Mn(2+)-dependent dipeptidase [Scatolibacter rhodanostii]